jgi:hypothetical protein
MCVGVGTPEGWYNYEGMAQSKKLINMAREGKGN